MQPFRCRFQRIDREKQVRCLTGVGVFINVRARAQLHPSAGV